MTESKPPFSELIERQLVTTEPLSPEQTKMVDEHMARREAVAKEMEEEKAPGSIWPSLKEVRRACLEGAGLIEKGAPLPPAAPLALTDRNIAALSRAIEAEGYMILTDPETEDVKLKRTACICDKGGLGDLCDGDCIDGRGVETNS